MTWKHWLCPAAAVALAAAVLALFGFTLWSIVGAVVLLACPVAAAWAYIAGERELRPLKQLRAAPTNGGSGAPRRAS
jgi:hypothetical protein